MSPKKTKKKLTWKQIDIEGKLDTLAETIKRTRFETPDNKTRLLGKVNRWEEQIQEIKNKIVYIKKTLAETGAILEADINYPSVAESRKATWRLFKNE